MIAVLACGDRRWTDEWFIERTLDDVLKEHDGMVLIEGCASGADELAGAWADHRSHKGVLHARFPADWNRYGKGAGPIRNQAMLDYLIAQQDANGGYGCVLAFHDDIDNSRGTADMVRRAKAAAVECHVLSHYDPGKPATDGGFEA